MNKIFLLLAIPFILFACSDDNEETKPKVQIPQEIAQDHTSIIFVYDRDIEVEQIDCVAGYYTSDKTWLKLGDLGTITPIQNSRELEVNIDTLQHVYIFMHTKLKGANFSIHQRTKEPFILKKNYKNVFNFANKEYEVVVGNAPWNYPI